MCECCINADSTHLTYDTPLQYLIFYTFKFLILMKLEKNNPFLT
jgi:hypothetical protein